MASIILLIDYSSTKTPAEGHVHFSKSACETPEKDFNWSVNHYSLNHCLQCAWPVVTLAPHRMGKDHLVKRRMGLLLGGKRDADICE